MMITRRLPLFLSLIAMTTNVVADPFADGNPTTGKVLVETNCTSCHAKKIGGDGSGIYLREARQVKTAPGLLTQIRYCQTMLNLSWFEEDELNVASYLNRQYYKFDH